jgi:hypothetical protein
LHRCHAVSKRSCRTGTSAHAPCTIGPNSPQIPLDTHIVFVLRYTTLPKQSPSTEELGNTKRKNTARYQGADFYRLGTFTTES